MKNYLWLCASLLPIIVGAPAQAFTMAQRAVIANQDCFVVRAPAGGLSAEQRLDQINDRLAYILGYETLKPNTIRTVRRGKVVEIRVGKSLLTTVTPGDARANGTRSVERIARSWTRNLRDALPQARPGGRIAAVPTGERMASAE